MPSGDANHRKAQARKAAFLTALVSNGGWLMVTLTETGLPMQTYYHYRATDPDFAAQCDTIRHNTKDIKGSSGFEGGFASFRKQFFGLDSYWHHHRMVDAIENAPEMGVTLVLLPPEHGKTTLIEDYCSMRIAQDPNMRITVVSEGQPHARKLLRRIKKRMTDPSNLAFIARFGPFKDDSRDIPWAADYFTVCKADHDERDYTMEARGWKSGIAGTRTDLLIVDDMQSLKSYSLTDDMVAIFRQDFMTRPGKTGRIIIIGTRVGEDDFYRKLIEAELVDRIVTLPATRVGEIVECEVGEACEVPDMAHEKPLCPEMWSSHQLAKRRRQVGESVWWRNYQQEPHSAGGETFTDAAIERCKNPLRLIAPLDDGTPILSLDPALGGGNALFALNLAMDSIRVLDLQRDFGLHQTEEILTGIELFARRYRPRAVVIEAVAFQRGLANDHRLADMGRRLGFYVVGHQTGMNKLDENLGVASMAATFNAGDVDIPWGNEEARARMEIFIQELHSWRPNVATRKLRQDTIMAFWFGWLFWQENLAMLRGDQETWGRKGLPWKPMAAKTALARKGA